MKLTSLTIFPPRLINNPALPGASGLANLINRSLWLPLHSTPFACQTPVVLPLQKIWWSALCANERGEAVVLQ